jgi:hypothetical protein
VALHPGDGVTMAEFERQLRPFASKRKGGLSAAVTGSGMLTSSGRDCGTGAAAGGKDGSELPEAALRAAQDAQVPAPGHDCVGGGAVSNAAF